MRMRTICKARIKKNNGSNYNNEADGCSSDYDDDNGDFLVNHKSSKTESKAKAKNKIHMK